ncbi:MAG: protein translocase subunit SecD [Candidatus Delongbacteria bacterium]
MEQHNNKLRWIIFAALLALAAWKLFPTLRLASMGEEAFKALTPDAQVELRKQSIKRGLDLQGGMHMVLEVDLVELMRGLARTPDARFNERLDRVAGKLTPLTDFWELFQNEFSDIQLSEYFGDRKQSNDELLAMLKQQAADAVDNSLVILRNRVDGSGLQEPSITKQGQRRIVVELAGVSDPEAARRMIGKTALLEFKMVEEVTRTNQVLEAINAAVKGEPLPAVVDSAAMDSTALASAKPDSAAQAAAPAKTDSAAFDPLAARTDTARVASADTNKAVTSFFELLTVFPGRNSLLVSEENRSRVQAVLDRPDIQALIPPDKIFLLGKTEDTGGKKYSELFLVHREAELTGKALESAAVNINQGGSGGSAGASIVELAMTREGARRFARITGDNVNRRLAIVLDNKVFMAPNIRNKIPNGRAIIEGLESIEEAKELANLLKHGALPSTVKPVEERTVGPSLGAESLKQGTMSALLAFAFTVLFMMVYYKLSGVYAVLALMANMVFIAAAMAGFHATLTLPGIAGLVLTIGMSVDANILVLERIREELKKGRTVRAAVDAGYTNAMSAIIDSNLTTLIAGVVLYQFGSGPIRGFALTLMIGLVANLYTAIILTRLLYDRFTNYDRATRLSI